MGRRQLVVMLFVFLLTFYTLIAGLRIDTGDGELVYQVARSMANGAGFAVPPPSGEHSFYGMWGVDGRYYSPTGWGASLSVLPFYWIGELCHRITGWGAPGYASRASVLLRNVIVGALTGCILFALARQLGYQQRPSAITALVIALATPFVVYVKTMFSEPLLTLLLVLALLTALRAKAGDTWKWFVAGGALGFGLLVKPTMLAVVPAFLGYAALTQAGGARWKAIAALTAPVLAGGLMTAWYNLVRFGSALSTGYQGVGFDQWPWIGLYGLLLSPGKGLLWFCPIVILGIAGWIPLATRQPRSMALIGSVVLLFLGVHSVYTVWHGGGGWGPRLIVPILPLLVLPLAEWLRGVGRPRPVQLAQALLLTLSLLVQLPAVVVNWARAAQSVYDASASPADYNRRILYSVAASPVWRQWVSFLEVSALMRDPQLRASVIQMAVDLGRRDALEPFYQAGNAGELTTTVGYLSFNTFDFWWVYWAMLRAPLWGIALLAGGLLLALGWSGWRLFKWLKAGENEPNDLRGEPD